MLTFSIKSRRPTAGFSLVELMVVVGIIRVTNFSGDAKTARVLGQVKNVRG